MQLRYGIITRFSPKTSDKCSRRVWAYLPRYTRAVELFITGRHAGAYRVDKKWGTKGID